MASAVARDRLAGGHWLAAGAAVVLSMVAHLVAVGMLPELPVGRMPEMSSYERRPAMALRDVRPQAPAVVDRPARYRPEQPGRTALTEEATRFLEVMKPVLRAADEAPAGQVPAPVQGPGGEPAAVMDVPARWEPRRDVFMIEQAMHAEDLRAAPRRFADRLPRSTFAPDIVTPAMADEILGMKTGLPGGGGRPAVSFGLAPPGTALAALPEHFLDAPSNDPGGVTREVVELVEEEAVDLVRLESVEQLLKLRLAVVRTQEEPGHGYFRIDIERRDAATMPVMPKDVLIIQDCSESMTQRKLNACKEGLRMIVAALAPQDRFDIMTFRERTTQCFGHMREATAQARARAVYFIEAMEARGKTDVYASLQHLMDIRRTEDRPLLALLVTDGRPTAGLVDSSDIIERFTRVNLGQVSVFAVGGGRQVNRFLLDLLSYRNRGEAQVVEARRDLAPALDRLGRQLARPVMMDLRYRFAGMDASELYPRTLTHLYLDRPLVLYGHFVGDEPRTAFQIVGVSADGKKDLVFDLDWDQAKVGGPEIRTQWAYHQVYDLIGRHIESGREDELNRAHAVADRFGLMVPYGRDVVFR